MCNGEERLGSVEDAHSPGNECIPAACSVDGWTKTNR